MEKLELKHLTPYLPYGLKDVGGHYYVGICTSNPDKYGTVDRNGNIYESRMFLMAEQENGAITWEAHSNMVLPILIPLSDLSKDELRGQGFWHHIDYLTHEHQAEPKRFPILDAPYEMVEYLLSKHYDIFGLIEKGLAINKNTL